MSPGKVLPLSSSNQTPGPSRRRKARRPRRPLMSYGTTVTLLKIILPTVAVALLVLVMLWPQFLLSDGRFQIVTQPTGDVGIDRLSMAILMFAALNRPVPSDEIESRAGGQFTAAAT